MVLGNQGVNAPFACVLISIVTLAGGGRSGPPEKTVKASERFKGLFLVVVVISNLGGGCVVLSGGSERIVIIPPVKFTVKRWFRDRAGGASDGIRGGAVMRCRALVERVMETTSEAGVVSLRPCRGEAGDADKRATGEDEPRGPRRRFEGLLVIRNGMDGAKSIGVDGLMLEIEFFPREVEPRNLRDG